MYASFVSRPPSPEEPLEKYNQQELEYWLLKRLSVDLAWRADPSSDSASSSEYQAAFLKAYTNAFTQAAYTTTRYRPIKCDETRPPIVFSLVEGGRWLLVPDIDGLGRVTAFDLGAGQIKRKQLVEPLDKVDVVRTSLMCIEVDRNEETLTFNMLLTCVNRGMYLCFYILCIFFKYSFHNRSWWPSSTYSRISRQIGRSRTKCIPTC